MLALTIPSFWVVLKLNSGHVHNPCTEKKKKKKREDKKLGAKMCSVVELGLFRRRACLCPNGQMFGCQLSFSSLVHLPRCFICSFECCLEKPRPPLACCTSGFLPSWSYEVLCGFFLPLLFLIPGCLHTSLGLRLACWTISKPGGGHDVVVILWFLNCFVMDCLNSKLIKHWQLWQDPGCSLSYPLCVCTNVADNSNQFKVRIVNYRPTRPLLEQ